jgi:hypothetical protein
LSYGEITSEFGCIRGLCERRVVAFVTVFAVIAVIALLAVFAFLPAFASRIGSRT